MASIEKAKEKLHTLVDKGKYEKMLGCAALLTELMEEHKIKPIIVGGMAVETYTLNEYMTSDLDIVISRPDLLNTLLISLGFENNGGSYFHSDLLITIEIPDDMLKDADYARVMKINLPNNCHVHMIGIEDIILDRLRACIHWKSTSDCEWGRRLLLLHHTRLDLAYLKECARKDGTGIRLDDWLSSI